MFHDLVIAGPPGFEPGRAVLETAMLPLTSWPSACILPQDVYYVQENSMNEAHGELHPPIQETEVPERNLLERFDRLWYLVRAATHPSRIPGEPREINRSLLNRNVRADLLRRYYELPKTDPAGRKRIIAEAHIRDEIARRYLNQGEITVNLPDLGPQTSRLLILDPPEAQTTLETEKKPPIYLIPSISADIDPVGGLAQELAFMGRKVVVIGYPESSLGRTTAEFADKASRSPNYEPHVTFFKCALRQVAPEGEIELWADSTGGPIVSEILNDQAFQKRVSQAVLFSPASSVDQSRMELAAGLAYEIGGFSGMLGRLPAYSLVWGRKTPDLPHQDKIKSAIFNAQLDKVCRKAKSWQQMKVKEGGKIVIWAGKNDRLTRSYELEQEVSDNPQVVFLKEEQGLHVTPLIEPQRILRDISAAQKS